MEKTMEQQQKNTSNRHILMLPWLAMGHLLPFFELSKRLASKGIKISFFSTPSNILRLPPIPQTLTPFLKFIPCSLLAADNLPFAIENTSDIHSDADERRLYQAYAEFQPHLADFLSDATRPRPTWIFYDYPAANWAPSLASRFGLGSATFCTVNAVAMSFFNRACECESPEELARLHERLPFATDVKFRGFEARQIYPMTVAFRSFETREADPGKLTLMRTCREAEGKWLDFLGDGYFPVGFVRPSSLDDEEEENEAWGRISRWLDEREDDSVVYAAFGSEVKLSRDQIEEIGLGLEKSGLPFLWAIRVGSPPAGFERRTEGRGVVWKGWVPQARVLAHRAVGGFMTHCGWNSAVEGLAVGVAMVVLPMQFDQGLNARHLVESGVGVEVERDDEDGSFCGEDVGRKLRFAMVDEEGEELRKTARRAGREVFGSEKLQEKYLDELVKKLEELEAKLV